MKKTDASASQEKVAVQSDKKEKECVKATDLSENLNEAVEKSLVKKSADEAKSSPI